MKWRLDLISDLAHGLGPLQVEREATTGGTCCQGIIPAQILREGLQPGAVLTRVAQSHVRVGTFEFFANRGDTEAVRLLADYVIARHYPDATGAERPYRALLETVIDRTAELIASWQLIGFIHGVMNTDNLSIAGETID